MSTHRAFIPLNELVCWRRICAARCQIKDAFGRDNDAVDAAITRLLILHCTFCEGRPSAETLLPTPSCPYVAEVARELSASLSASVDNVERVFRLALSPPPPTPMFGSGAASPRLSGEQSPQSPGPAPASFSERAPAPTADAVLVVTSMNAVLVFCAETCLATIEISAGAFDRLCCRWLENRTNRPDEVSMWSAIATLMMRYDNLDCWGSSKSVGYQLRVVGPLLSHLCELELFAAPFNAYMTRYCSLFPDVDARFGSVGKYPQILDWVKRDGRQVSVAANPPFIEQVLIDLAERATALCEHGVSWIILTADWSDNKGVQLLERSEYRASCPDIDPYFTTTDCRLIRMDRFRTFCLKPRRRAVQHGPLPGRYAPPSPSRRESSYSGPSPPRESAPKRKSDELDDPAVVPGGPGVPKRRNIAGARASGGKKRKRSGRIKREKS